MNVSQIKDCYGCGVCAMACTKQIITISLNSNGFYEPQIQEIDRCTNCGLCVNVCSYSHNELSLKNPKIKSFAAWSNNEEIRTKCSSGGISFEIGKLLLQQKYKICCVKYNPQNNRAEHYIAKSIEELSASIGSKYIQSYTVNGFKEINRREKYLITGTPCQIDSFRRYIQKFHCEDNFILLDFFCHGVPSMHLWTKYTQWIKQQMPQITFVSWRNKQNGWHDSWAIKIKGYKKTNQKDTIYSSRSQGDMFYNLFLSDTCLGKQCYQNCKYKCTNSSADIRIGDLWGQKYATDQKGISAVITFTPKGEECLQKLNCTMLTESIEVVTEGQMKSNPAMPYAYNQVIKSLKNNQSSIIDCIKTLKRESKKERNIKRIKHPIRTLINIFNKLRTKL